MLQFRIIQFLTAWFLFFVLICGFLLYDLIDPALKRSIEQLENEEDHNHDKDLENEPLSPNEEINNSGSLTKVLPEVGVQPISPNEIEKY